MKRQEKEGRNKQRQDSLELTDKTSSSLMCFTRNAAISSRFAVLVLFSEVRWWQGERPSELSSCAMKYKLVALDLDGTLVHTNHSVSDRAVKVRKVIPHRLLSPSNAMLKPIYAGVAKAS